MTKIVILGIGSYLPLKVLTNDDLASKIDTSHEWIKTRTGIEKRHICDDQESVVSMAEIACSRALQEAQISATDIDFIIFATTTHSQTFPAAAALLQSRLGASKAFAFDIQAVCSGFLYAYYTAVQLMKGDQKLRYGLIIGSEAMSTIVDWSDRSTCILFGDGAGAVVLCNNSALESEDYNPKNLVYGVYQDAALRTDGSLSDILYADGHPTTIKMKGSLVYVHAIQKLYDIIQELCVSNSLEPQDINHFIIHQANVRILASLADKLNVEPERIAKSIGKHANTSAASIPLLLDDYKSNFKSGDWVIMAGVGGGFTWGAALLRWENIK